MRWSSGGRRPAVRPALHLLAALVAVSVSSCASHDERVPLPAVDAEAAVVVQAYLDAHEVEDCDTARALYRPEREPPAPWCAEVQVFDATVGETQDDGCCGVGSRYAQSVYVPVDVVTRGGDASLPDGDTPWGYVLVRDSDDQPWRIADEGH